MGLADGYKSLRKLGEEKKKEARNCTGEIREGGQGRKSGDLGIPSPRERTPGTEEVGPLPGVESAPDIFRPGEERRVEVLGTFALEDLFVLLGGIPSLGAGGKPLFGARESRGVCAPVSLKNARDRCHRARRRN